MTTQVLETPAHLCSHLRVPYSRVWRAIEQLKLKPVAIINGVAHFDGKACERVAEHIASKANKT